MVAVGALMVMAVYLVHTHGLFTRRHIEAPTKHQNHQQPTARPQEDDARERKRSYCNTLWRPNMTHNLAPVGASIQDAARNLRSRRFSVA